MDLALIVHHRPESIEVYTTSSPHYGHLRGYEAENRTMGGECIRRGSKAAPHRQRTNGGLGPGYYD